MFFRKRIIHIVNDEKFIDSTFKEFEREKPGINVFIILSKKIDLKFIKSTPIVFIRPRIMLLLIRILPYFSEALIFHSLFREFDKKLILDVPKKVKILWISWGFDIYPYLNEKNSYFLDMTKKLLVELGGELKDNYSGKEFIYRVDYFSTVIPEEFEDFSRKYSIALDKYIPWNYLTIEDHIVKGFEEKVVIGDNILFGNSGSEWLNHYDGFQILKSFPIEFDQIICPLGYGNGKYSNKIQELGFQEFGDRFQPIKEFLPYDDYVKVLLSCKFLFLNSIRQIGMANILLMLFIGAKIVLRKENPSYQFLKNNHLPVYTIEDLDDLKVSRDELLETRRNLIRIWGKEVIHQKTKLLVDKLTAS
jgi:hypothetical protein